MNEKTVPVICVQRLKFSLELIQEIIDEKVICGQLKNRFILNDYMYIYTQ